MHLLSENFNLKQELRYTRSFANLIQSGFLRILSNNRFDYYFIKNFIAIPTTIKISPTTIKNDDWSSINPATTHIKPTIIIDIPPEL